MSFTEKLLMQDEKIEYQTKLDPWMAFSQSGGMFLMAFVAFGIGWRGVGKFLLAWAVIVFPFEWINQKTSYFVITNKRVLVRTGLVKRMSLELMLTKIEGIVYEESLTERVNRTGRLVICGTGGTKQIVPRIKDPLEFKRRLQEKLDQIRATA